MISNLVKDRFLRWAIVVSLITTGITLLLYISPLYKSVGSYSVAWVYDSLTSLFALVDMLLAALLWRSFGQGEALKPMWGSMALGLLLWTAGEMIWAYYELILKKETPYPSIADVGWTLGFIPLLIALSLRYRSLRTAPARKQLAIGMGVFALLLVLAIVFVIGPILTSDDSSSLTQQLFNMFYPVGDLAVALIALLCVFVLAGGVLSRPWMLIAAGFLVVSIADLLFCYANWNDIYWVGSGTSPNAVTTLSDVLYLASYQIILLGLIMQARLQRVI
jgi:hypothetical protein